MAERDDHGRFIKKENANTIEEEAYRSYNKIKALQKAGIGLFIEMGKTLFDIRENKLYLHMGEGGMETYKDFLASPEIGFSEQSAYVYTSVYEFYCLKLGYSSDDIQDMPLNRLKRMIPLLKDKKLEEAKQTIEDTKGMTSKDFEAEVSERDLTPTKPQVWIDGATSKWIIKFKPDTTLKIINSDNGENILQPIIDGEETE